MLKSPKCGAGAAAAACKWCRLRRLPHCKWQPAAYRTRAVAAGSCHITLCATLGAFICGAALAVCRAGLAGTACWSLRGVASNGLQQDRTAQCSLGCCNMLWRALASFCSALEVFHAAINPAAEDRHAWCLLPLQHLGLAMDAVLPQQSRLQLLNRGPCRASTCLRPPHLTVASSTAAVKVALGCAGAVFICRLALAAIGTCLACATSRGARGQATGGLHQGSQSLGR
jgi:hypothetical protein